MPTGKKIFITALLCELLGACAPNFPTVRAGQTTDTTTNLSPQADDHSPCFGEPQLALLIQELRSAPHAEALLYVWSPRMVLSAVHSDIPARVAQSLGAHFYVLHDHRIPESELSAAKIRLKDLPNTSAQALAQSMPLCAQSLITRDAYRHFPTSFVVTRQGVHPQPIIGAMPEKAWRQSIQERSEELTQQRKQGWYPVW